MNDANGQTHVTHVRADLSFGHPVSCQLHPGEHPLVGNDLTAGKTVLL